MARVKIQLPPDEVLKRRSVRLPQTVWDQFEQLFVKLNEGRNSKLTREQLLALIVEAAAREELAKKR